MRDLSPDFRELLDEFERAEVEYLVVGGYAVGFHGHPRYTAGFDVWVRKTQENAERIASALRAFGAPQSATEAIALARGETAIGFGTPPLQVHLLNFLTGCDWETAASRTLMVSVGGGPARILSLIDLVRTKRAVDRPQDRADLHRLAKIHSELPEVEDA